MQDSTDEELMNIINDILKQQDALYQKILQFCNVLGTYGIGTCADLLEEPESGVTRKV